MTDEQLDFAKRFHAFVVSKGTATYPPQNPSTCALGQFGVHVNGFNLHRHSEIAQEVYDAVFKRRNPDHEKVYVPMTFDQLAANLEDVIKEHTQ